MWNDPLIMKKFWPAALHSVHAPNTHVGLDLELSVVYILIAWEL